MSESNQAVLRHYRKRNIQAIITLLRMAVRSGFFFLIAGGLMVEVAGCASKSPKNERASAPNSGSVPDVAPEVAAEFKKSSAAWNAGDLDGFTAIYADSATFAQREVFIVGRPAIRTLYAPLFAPGASRPNLTLERLDIEQIAPGVVLVRGIYRNSREGAVVGRGTTTLVMRLIQGQWRIVHDHSS